MLRSCDGSIQTMVSREDIHQCCLGVRSGPVMPSLPCTLWSGRTYAVHPVRHFSSATCGVQSCSCDLGHQQFGHRGLVWLRGPIKCYEDMPSTVIYLHTLVVELASGHHGGDLFSHRLLTCRCKLQTLNCRPSPCPKWHQMEEKSCHKSNLSSATRPPSSTI